MSFNYNEWNFSVRMLVVPHMQRLALPLSLAVISFGCGEHFDGPLETRRETRTIPLDKAEMVRVNLRMGVGELTLDGGANQLMEGDFTYSTPSRAPEIDYRPGASRGELTISQRQGAMNHGESRWSVKLNDTVPLDIDAKLGVGEASMNLSKSNLRSLEVRMGVGEVSLDLRGTPKRSYDVRINGGVGEAKVMLPKTVGIVATARGGIGDINVRGLEKKGGYWYNPGHDNDAVTIRIDVHGGVGEISLVAE